MTVRTFNRFDFGKYRGMRVDDVALMDPSYLSYCERQGHVFSNGVKRIQREGFDRQNAYRSNGGFY